MTEPVPEESTEEQNLGMKGRVGIQGVTRRPRRATPAPTRMRAPVSDAPVFQGGSQTHRTRLARRGTRHLSHSVSRHWTEDADGGSSREALSGQGHRLTSGGFVCVLQAHPTR